MTRVVRILAALVLPPYVFTLILFLGAGLGLAGRPYADPDALWNIVHRLCVTNEERFGDPAPCQRVELRSGDRNGYAVLKDPFRATQFLLIPTARITGIESPALVAGNAPNYFASAWRSRTYVDHAVHRVLPRSDVALAVNSASARTQNQLHIHIDCVRADVRSALQREETISDRWAPLGVLLTGHRYLAMRVDAAQLDGVNPFKLLADGVPGARQDMGDHTLVVIGAVSPNGRPGFIILDDRVDPAVGDQASGEELQDHTCAVAKWSS
jgi:CDP-diacylglycerol pyrophosphatase